MTVVASGGDDAQVFGISTVTGVEYPASDPSVTGAGGTTLNFNSAGTAVSEAAFDYSGPYSSVVNVAGASSLFAIPSWQASAIAAAAAGNPPQTFGDGLHRIVPDVAAFAIGVQGGSSYTYALDYDSNLAVNRFDAVYGTSVSAPIWAGVAALINQERARPGKPARRGPQSATLPVARPRQLQSAAPLSDARAGRWLRLLLSGGHRPGQPGRERTRPLPGRRILRIRDAVVGPDRAGRNRRVERPGFLGRGRFPMAGRLGIGLDQPVGRP